VVVLTGFVVYVCVGGGGGGCDMWVFVCVGFVMCVCV